MNDSGDATSRYLRTELLERIAHELRGPAGVTLGALDELEHALGAEQSEQHRLLFAMARRGAKRVLRTAERLTRTALLESGSFAVHAGSTDLRTLVRQAVRDAELIEGRSSVQVRLTVPEEPCVVDVDSGWWAVALSELVSQAIRCARRNIEVSLEQEGAAMTVHVRDDRAAIIEPPAKRFVTLEDRRDAALGWPLICDVARAHRATVTSDAVRDEKGALLGSRVSVTLAASTPALDAAGE